MFLRVCPFPRTHLGQESKLARDVAKFIKSLQIPKEHSEWVVDDETISASERSGGEGNEGTNDTPLLASEAALVKGKAPKYVCTKLEYAKLITNLFHTALSPHSPLVFSAPVFTIKHLLPSAIRIYNHISLILCRGPLEARR